MGSLSSSEPRRPRRPPSYGAQLFPHLTSPRLTVFDSDASFVRQPFLQLSAFSVKSQRELQSPQSFGSVLRRQSLRNEFPGGEVESRSLGNSAERCRRIARQNMTSTIVEEGGIPFNSFVSSLRETLTTRSTGGRLDSPRPASRRSLACECVEWNFFRMEGWRRLKIPQTTTFHVSPCQTLATLPFNLISSSPTQSS